MGVVVLELSVRLEEQLQHKLVGGGVPAGEETALAAINGVVRDLESDCLVGIACKQHILEVLVGNLHLLLKGGHEAMAGLRAGLGLRIFHFEGQSALHCAQIARLCHLQRERTVEKMNR